MNKRFKLSQVEFSLSSIKFYEFHTRRLKSFSICKCTKVKNGFIIIKHGCYVLNIRAKQLRN